MMASKFKECIIVGGGNSVQQGIKEGLWDKIKGREVWSTNFVFMTMPYLPSREIWLDKSFFKSNIVKLEELYKNGVPCYTKKNAIYANIPEIQTYPSSREVRDFDNEEKLFSGGSGLTGTFSLSLAIRERYWRIYLLGFDFGTVSKDDKNTHYYQHSLNVHSVGFGNPQIYREEKNQEQVKSTVEEYKLFLNRGAEIVNVSPNSNIHCFQKISYTEFFRRINETKNK